MTAVLLGLLQQFLPYIVLALGALGFIGYQKHKSRQEGIATQQQADEQKHEEDIQHANEVRQENRTVPTSVIHDRLQQWNRD